jgi:hypothetical protein
MSIFIFSLLAGLALHRMVSIIQPAKVVSRYRLEKRIVKLGRSVVITFEDGAYVSAKLWALAVAFLLFFGFAVILIAQFVHPAVGFPYRFADTLRSSRMAAVVFGGLVGILLGNLLNRILRAEDDYKFTSADRLEIALIFALVVLGIGGEELLRSSVQRINKISVTEISFSDPASKSPRQSTEQPRGALQNTQGEGKSGGSAGLGKLYDIGSVNDFPHIERDRQLIEVLARYEREAVAKPGDVGRVAFDVLSPLASCLSRISRLYGDDAFVEQQLAPVAVVLRGLLTAGGSVANESIRSTLTRASMTVREYDRSRKNDFEAIASKLRLQLDERTACNRLTDDQYGRALALTDASINQFRESRGSLPYVAMTYASVMAALHNYEAAAITMDNWIEAHKPARSTADKWYLLRAQVTQAFFVEEWIRFRGAAASTQLRQYHIDNLKGIIDGMASFSAIRQISQRNDGYKWSLGLFGASASGDEGICDVPALPEPVTSNDDSELTRAEAENRLMVIYNTYLSARKDYVDHSLKHPTEKVKSASLIEDEITTLMPLSLKCISYGPAGQRRTRAEHIERFVRSELNMLENLAPLKSKDEMGEKVREAKQLLTVASQLILQQVKDAKKISEAGPIQQRIATDPVLELDETLLATQAQLQSFSEREGVN